MTEPELFGRPMSSGLAPWPGSTPAVVASAAIDAAPDQAPRPRIRLDWKFFAVAAVVAAVAIAILFMVTTASAADLPARGPALAAAFTALAGGPPGRSNRA